MNPRGLLASTVAASEGWRQGTWPGAWELRLVPDGSVDWSVDDPFESPQFANRRDEIPLLLHRRRGNVELRSHARGIEGGWSNGATFGNDNAPLDRVIAHWFNLPNWHGPVSLEETTTAGEHRLWRGRWVFEAEGWMITLDVRHDHSAVWTDLQKSDVRVMTHVMEIRRMNGSAFTGREAEPVLGAMQIGMSFALGRWVAPLLPVGLDAPVLPLGRSGGRTSAILGGSPASAGGMSRTTLRCRSF